MHSYKFCGQEFRVLNKDEQGEQELLQPSDYVAIYVTYLEPGQSFTEQAIFRALPYGRAIVEKDIMRYWEKLLFVKISGREVFVWFYRLKEWDKDYVHYKSHLFPIFLFLGLQGRFMAHSSFVEYMGHTALFLGPSGSGKTYMLRHFLEKGASFGQDEYNFLKLNESGVYGCLPDGTEKGIDFLFCLGYNINEGVRPKLQKLAFKEWVRVFFENSVLRFFPEAMTDFLRRVSENIRVYGAFFPAGSEIEKIIRGG